MRDGTPLHRSRGQVAVIFAGAMLVFVLLAATVIDMSWYWTNNLRIQRAADAAALAGVVFLPEKPSQAFAAARAEAGKNGFVDGVNGVTVTPVRDLDNDRRLLVTITADVDTYFARVVGIRSWPANRTAKADFILPIPMGSPEHYYGVFGKVRTPGGGTNVPNPPDRRATSWFSPDGHSPDAGYWTDPVGAYQSGTGVASKDEEGLPETKLQAWGGFDVILPSPPASPGTEQSFAVDGIELGVRAMSDAAGCELRASLTWTGAEPNSGSWTDPRTIALGTTMSDETAGGASDTWGRSWGRGDLDNGSFRARLERFDPGDGCADDFTASVDHVEVRVFWTQVTTTFVPDVNLAGPNGEVLNPRGYWGTMLTQGADDINGDAYLPNFEGGSAINTEYDPDRYYDYGVDMTASTGGSVYIYDPGFCATSTDGKYGTGDRWFTGQEPVSSWFELWDTMNTPFTREDDVRVDPTDDDDLFTNIRASDPTLRGPATGGGMLSCAQGATSDQGDGRYWHNRWWQLASGLPGGTVYRIRTRTTDPNNASAQINADAENSFAIYASAATGNMPNVFGIGAMQSFSPLSGDETSEFYLAQIDDVYAGKTVVISLWDPGDTGSLTGDISIRVPSATGYTSADLSWSSERGTTHGSASSCNGLADTGTTIATHSSGQRFNGCWVTILVAIPAEYSTAVAPPGEAEPGWWKIRYTMAGSPSDTSLDVTTWRVDIRGNPVHLVLP